MNPENKARLKAIGVFAIGIVMVYATIIGAMAAFDDKLSIEREIDRIVLNTSKELGKGSFDYGSVNRSIIVLPDGRLNPNHFANPDEMELTEGQGAWEMASDRCRLLYERKGLNASESKSVCGSWRDTGSYEYIAGGEIVLKPREAETVISK